MKTTHVILAVVIIALVVSVSFYGAYYYTVSPPSSTPTPNPTTTPTSQPSSTANTSPNSTPTSGPTVTASPSSSPTAAPTVLSSPTATPSPTVPPTVTYTDSTGAQITIKTPVNKIISLNSGITELICAMGAQSRLVGRDSGSVFPDSVSNITVVGSSSASPNAELIIAQSPDVLIADSMISSQTTSIQKIQDAGIKVIIETPGNISRLPILVQFLGTVLNNPAKATDITNYVMGYVNLVDSRLATLTRSQKPIVYFEMSTAWRTTPAGSVREAYLIEAGGINLAENTTGNTLTPEFIATSNPDIIVRMVTSSTHSTSDFQSVYNDIMSRTQISLTNAVKNNHVYIYDSALFTGLRYPIGLLYWAKWFHPELFADIDPAAIHQQLIQKYFGTTLQGVYVYP